MFKEHITTAINIQKTQQEVFDQHLRNDELTKCTW